MLGRIDVSSFPLWTKAELIFAWNAVRLSGLLKNLHRRD